MNDERPAPSLEPVGFDIEVTGARTRAALIDIIPMVALFLAMAAMFGEVGSGSAQLSGWGFVHYLALLVVYYTVSEAMTGTTVGKWTVGLKVVNSEGRKPKLLPLLIRNIVRILDFFPVFYISGILMIWKSPGNRRLGDIAARTQVVRQLKAAPIITSFMGREEIVEADSLPAPRQKESIAPRMLLAISIVALISGISIYLSPITAGGRSEAVDRFNSGIGLFEQGRLEEAIAEYDEVIRLNPKLAPAYNNRGLAYGEMGELERAISDFNEAIRLDPQYTLAYNNRGRAYGKLGQLERAIEDYDTTIRLDPQFVLAYSNRGAVYGEMGQLERAISELDEAILLDPQLAPAYNNRGRAYTDLGQPERSIADLDEAIRLDSQFALAYNNRGLAYTDLGHPERAIADLDEAIRLDSQFALAYNNRGRAYTDLGQPERAIPDLDEAISLDPQLMLAYYNRGDAYAMLSQLERAIEDYDAAIRLVPQYALNYTNRAIVYTLLGEDVEARQDIERAVELGSDRTTLETIIENVKSRR